MADSADYYCPYCKRGMSLSASYVTLQEIVPLSEAANQFSAYVPHVIVEIDQCPRCKHYSYFFVCAIGPDHFRFSYPINGKCIAVPDYVPLAIRNDYSEAYAIMELSPKSAATLARRCLQGMIRDFWGISKNNLAAAIDELSELIPIQQQNAIDAVRMIGNIGAHMGKDVNQIIEIEPNEAELLLQLVGYLIQEWYVASHDREKLFQDITALAERKQEQRDQTKPEDSRQNPNTV